MRYASLCAPVGGRGNAGRLCFCVWTAPGMQLAIHQPKVSSRSQRPEHQYSVVQGGGDQAPGVFDSHCNGNRAKVSAMSSLQGTSMRRSRKLPASRSRGRVKSAFNRTYRLALSLAYPVLCKIERTFRVRSNVALVAVWHGESLLVVRHSYRLGHALPGGTIRAGEAPVEAAARELCEEVGILTSPSDLVLLRRWTQKEGKRWLFDFHPPKLPDIVPDEREVIEAQFVARSRIPTRVRVMLEQPA
jgi:hypothetical protein